MSRVGSLSDRKTENRRIWGGKASVRDWLRGGSLNQGRCGHERLRWPSHHPFGSGLTTVKSGKREKSRSADQSTRTP